MYLRATLQKVLNPKHNFSALYNINMTQSRVKYSRQRAASDFICPIFLWHGTFATHESALRITVFSTT
jgi:hypothetical protein